MRTIGIIASGPSATREDALTLLEICDEVIVINDTWRLLREAQHLYASDSRWWRWAIADVSRDFEGQLWTQAEQWADDPGQWGIHCLESDTDAKGLCTQPGKIHTGMNSGYAAINLAYHLGAKRILLLGYDMSMDGNRRHWFDDRPENMNMDTNYADLVKCFKTIDPAKYDLEILNCTRRTALNHFPKHSLEECLASL